MSTSLVDEFARVIMVVNPQSSNVQRIEKRGRELAALFPDREIVLVETTVRPGQLATKLKQELRGQADQLGLTLLAIGGGDGTVHLVVNALMELRETIGPDLAMVPLLPLWGGNANDLATMLNGQPSRTSLRGVLQRGRVVAIHPFEVTTGLKDGEQTTRYAACYASFGAIAYAADKLAQPSVGHGRLKKVAAGKVADEMLRAWRAWLEAPSFDAEGEDGRRMKIFEQVFANGPRMAKVARLPVRLDERRYYRAAGADTDRDHHPLFFLFRLIRGKKVGEVTDRTVRFTLRERAWAQFDGEATVLPEHTHVTVSHADTPFYAISTKL